MLLLNANNDPLVPLPLLEIGKEYASKLDYFVHDTTRDRDYKTQQDTKPIQLQNCIGFVSCFI